MRDCQGLLETELETKLETIRDLWEIMLERLPEIVGNCQRPLETWETMTDYLRLRSGMIRCCQKPWPLETTRDYMRLQSETVTETVTDH